MTLYHGILFGRILLLVALGSLFLCLALGVTASRRLRILIFAVLIGALLSFPNFGVLHPTHSGYRAGHIHYYDAFHYFMGAKYLPELGYHGLYEATLVAGRDLGAFSGIPYVRDLRSYSLRTTTSVDSDAVRARFSKQRWQMFQNDLIFFGPRIDAWPELLTDRGYNDPPPRALLLHMLLDRIPASPVTLTILTSLDYVALIVAFVVVWQTFGEIPSALALAFFSLNFFARFDFIGGSVLRWDWTAALLVGVAAYARRSGTISGIFLGYSVLARVFPIVFLTPLIVKWLQARFSKTHDAVLASCLRAALGLILLVSTSLMVSGEQRADALEFLTKMRLHAEDPFINSVGVGSMMVFGSAPWKSNPDGTVYVTAEAVAGARRPSYELPLISAGCLLLVLPLIRRAQPLESVLYAVPLVFCALSLTGYYYSFLVLLVLLPWGGGAGVSRISFLEMALLACIMAAAYAFELASPDLLPLFYQASIQMGLFFLVWVGFEYVRLGLVGKWPVAQTTVD
jgi:hypothetical protein